MLVKHLMNSACSTKGTCIAGCMRQRTLGHGSARVSLSQCMCVCACVCKGKLCVGWEWGTLVSQLLCASLPTADPRAVNPASIPAKVNTL